MDSWAKMMIFRFTSDQCPPSEGETLSLSFQIYGGSVASCFRHLPPVSEKEEEREASS